ncbi:MAG: YacP-like NYN domain protein [Syntrophaceae bacterium PtaB.Bin095]|jgi:predicted RNA-binding protein with PIN domain|nr:MAG: YacP-like NYN domain protein [Syntrophaceae bacterium PtaB.Bin095]
MHLIIDGYNLIRQSDAFRQSEKVSLEEGRHALLRSLSQYRKRTGHRITVVFDAWVSGSPEVERDRYGSIAILYSQRGRTADDLIKRIVQERREALVVVTSDREIADFAARRGVPAVSSPDFEARLLEAATGAARPAGNAVPDRNGVREDREPSSVGTKKKGPSRRLSKKQRAVQSAFRKL